MKGEEKSKDNNKGSSPGAEGSTLECKISLGQELS
jgi:hypothetical protein